MGNRPKLASQKVHVKAAAKDRVVLAYIHPGETSSYFTQSLMNLLMFDQATSRRVVGCINEWSSANVSPARNSLTGRFLDEYDAECTRSNEAIATLSLDTVEQGPYAAKGDAASLRYILCHMIEETARHVGHMDIIRELLDGRTGYTKPDEA